MSTIAKRGLGATSQKKGSRSVGIFITGEDSAVMEAVKTPVFESRRSSDWRMQCGGSVA